MIPRMEAIMNESDAKEKSQPVIPAEAGIHRLLAYLLWVPACAGTTARALSARF